MLTFYLPRKKKIVYNKYKKFIITNSKTRIASHNNTTIQYSVSKSAIGYVNCI